MTLISVALLNLFLCLIYQQRLVCLPDAFKLDKVHRITKTEKRKGKNMKIEKGQGDAMVLFKDIALLTLGIVQ